LLVLVNNPNDITEWLEVADFNAGRPVGEQITYGFNMNQYPQAEHPHIMTIYSSGSGSWSRTLLLYDTVSAAAQEFPIYKNISS
jgi:hypothetical protein